MATQIGAAYLALTARNAQLKAKLNESEKVSSTSVGKMQRMWSRFGKVAFAGAVAGITAVTAVMIKATKAAAAEQLQTVQLRHQLKRLAVDTEENVRRTEELAASMQKYTRFGDTVTRSVLQDLITLSNDFEGSMKNLSLVFDIAESGMFDVRTAARYVGLAMTGNVEILGRYIAELKGSTNEQLKSMSAQEKARYAIDLLEKKFGGLAKTVGDTTAGAWAKLTNAVSDAWEALGKGALEETSDNMNELTESIKESEDELETLGGIIADVGVAFLSFGKHVVRGAGIIGEKIGEIREANRQYIKDFEKWMGAEEKYIWSSATARDETAKRGHEYHLQRERDLGAVAKAAEDAAARERYADQQTLREKRKRWVEERTEDIQAIERLHFQIAENKRLDKAERNAAIAATLAREKAQDAAESVMDAIGRLEKRNVLQGFIDAAATISDEIKNTFKFKLEDIDLGVKAPREAPAAKRPEWIGAQQLWKRAATMVAKAPEIKVSVDRIAATEEDKKSLIELHKQTVALQGIQNEIKNVGKLQ